MTKKRLKIALFKNVPYGFESVYTTDHEGREREVSDHARISEWIEIDFPLLPPEELQARKQSEVEAVKARLQRQLAALDKEDAK